MTTAKSGCTYCAHAGDDVAAPPEVARPHAAPLYQTTSFVYPDHTYAEAAARGEQYIYTRYANPTEAALTHAIAGLEGAEESLFFASGMGAIAATLERYVGAGGHMVSVDGLYGGTHELITSLLPRFGAAATLVAAARPDAIAAALRPDTRLVYVESISNPLLRVADIDGVAALCRDRGLPLVVDATFATPLLQRPLARGATLVVHSTTKYINGHGDVIGGVVSGARAELADVARLRKLHGASPDPFAAWLTLRGLRTLGLRLERQVANAGRIARALGELPAVERVHYPGLPSHPDHAIASRQLDGAGAMVSFEVRGGLAAARRVFDGVRLIARSASLGDVRSLFTHPATFSHVGMSAEERRRAGIGDGLLRLSVGIEDAEDVVADLAQALGD